MDELTNCEVLAMKVIWHSEEALSIQEITRAVNAAYDKDWKVQTVSTFLSKMVKKGYLDMQRKGRFFSIIRWLQSRSTAIGKLKSASSFGVMEKSTGFWLHLRRCIS